MPRSNPDKSTDPTVIEYAVRFMHKGKTPRQAAVATKKKLHGAENLMLGGGVVEIDEDMLEVALYARILGLAQYGLSRGWTPEDSVRSALQSNFYQGFDDKTLALVAKVIPEVLARMPRSNPSERVFLDEDLHEEVVAEAKARFAVWPSAYASGWVTRTYKERGGRFGGKARGQRAGLTRWFGEEWVDLSRPIHDEDGELVGYEPCGRKTAQDASNDPAAYPKCRPLKEAMRMSPSEVKDAIKRKRAAEAKAGRGGRGGRGARAPVRVSTYRTNPMREPGDVPGFRIAVIEHQKPGAFKGRIILVAYTDDGQMLAWIAALPASLRSETSTSSGPRAAAFPELRGYNDDAVAVVWEVAKAHAWVDGWGPLLYEALLAFVASKGYSGWVTSDAGMTSKEARAVWRRFSERDDVEFQHDVGKNVNGQPIDAMRALPDLLAKRAPLLKKLDRRAAYTRAVKQFLRGSADQSSGRFVPLESEARANPDVTSTQAFRRWFGDSKVVDAAGEPLVVYHGTDKSFDVFKSTTKEAFYGKGGMYFSNVREAAQTFAPSVENVMPVYLALQNPYFDDGEDGGVTIAKIKRRGFDGIVREADFVDEDGDVQDHTIYVAFYPEQIKLADGTNTTFDPKSPDVRANPDADAAARLGPVVDAEEWDDGTVVEFVDG